MLLDQHDACQWHYVAEGNANIVLRYTGNNPDLQGQVIRLQKTGGLGDNMQVAKFSVDFLSHIIAPLIGWQYLLPMKIVQVTPMFLHLLKERIKPERPAHRLIRDIDASSSWAFLSRDLMQRWWPQKTLTVELKPKWGFKPSSPFIVPEHQALKRTMCRFCMHSHLKGEKSMYCPLDLYSKCPTRMQRALKGLGQYPQGKLAFYLDGQSLLPENLKQGGLPGFGSWDHIMEMVQKVLEKDPILSKLKLLQQQLDELDVEAIHDMYQQNHDGLDPFSLDAWKEVVEQFKQRTTSIQDAALTNAKQRLFEYVLSMTFKDCSIMLCVTPISHDSTSLFNASTSQNTVIELSSKVRFAYDIRLIDLDMKKMTKIPYWYALDQQIVQYILQHHLQRECAE
ncbi:inositol-pentakisphosphate 2-kinase [Radiomyces spectabilis]|uniref:inositol-pentakisphosphate 2-kinase n=1 Tax=Radiomyces spectabilis TaxID=64574 RepID=UPI00221F4B00|nr:inositol-pentakisphosphate 2-kinase [Radiomyces spectabilis]KAI8366757.1 inositol-pentakisphosphate 2-kinase [Radiomyces spectabilis]